MRKQLNGRLKEKQFVRKRKGHMKNCVVIKDSSLKRKVKEGGNENQPFS